MAKRMRHAGRVYRPPSIGNPFRRTLTYAGASASKPLPVVAWACANSSQKSPPHRIRAGKAAARRHALQGRFTLLEKSPRRIDPRHLDEVGGRCTGLTLKHTRKVAHAHSDPTCQCLQAQVEREMIENPVLQGSNLSLVSDLRRQMGAELRWPPGASERPPTVAPP